MQNLHKHIQNPGQKTVFVAGIAGFIGSKVAEVLLKKGYRVVGVDNFNNYYSPLLKKWRIKNLLKIAEEKGAGSLIIFRGDISSFRFLEKTFGKLYKSGIEITAVINEAARAGVRASMKDPWIYLEANSLGNLNLLEVCRRFGIKKYILASTSSLYAGEKMPFSETLPVNKPISPYAASKKASETMAYTYSYLYGINVVVFRYFTVYGPAGRPDMSIFRFIRWALEDKPVILFGDGTQSRDFTYVDDIAEGTVLGMEAKLDSTYEVINLGNDNPHTINEVLEFVSKYTGRKLRIERRAFLKVDMKSTWADISKARNMLSWAPKVHLEEGIRRTVEWFRNNPEVALAIPLP